MLVSDRNAIDTDSSECGVLKTNDFGFRVFVSIFLSELCSHEYYVYIVRVYFFAECHSRPCNQNIPCYLYTVRNIVLYTNHVPRTRTCANSRGTGHSIANVNVCACNIIVFGSPRRRRFAYYISREMAPTTTSISFSFSSRASIIIIIPFLGRNHRVNGSHLYRRVYLFLLPPFLSLSVEYR